MNTTTPPFFLVSRIHSFAKLKSRYLLNQAFVDPSISILDDSKLPPNDQRKLTERRSRKECICASPVHRCVLEKVPTNIEILSRRLTFSCFLLSLVDVELRPGSIAWHILRTFLSSRYRRKCFYRWRRHLVAENRCQQAVPRSSRYDF